MTAMNLATTQCRVPSRSIAITVAGGLACALAIGKALPVTMDAVSGALAPLCATAAESSPLDKVEPIGSYALPNVPGKRVTILRVFYGPGGFSRPHRHAGSVTAYITKGRDPLPARRRSGRDVWRRPVLLRAARLDPFGLGQCQHHGAGGIDRGIRGGRGRAADDVAGVAGTRNPKPPLFKSAAIASTVSIPVKDRIRRQESQLRRQGVQ
ncbi:hypothetical protein ACVWWK_005737 [Bradyrhizobium sp. LB9.1b]